MRLVVFGSTGATGALVLQAAVRRGIEVTAFARDGGKLPNRDGLTGVVLGDGRDRDAVLKALAGQDAAILSVSGQGEPHVARDVARAVTEAMETAGVRRLVAASSYGIIAQRPYVVASAVRRVFAKQFSDQRAADEVISTTELDWTIARATRLVPKGSAGAPRVSTKLFDVGPFSLNREVWAELLLDVASDNHWPRQFINVTGS